jgi:hypothetical protein
MIAFLLAGGWFVAESLTWITILAICGVFAVPCFLIGAIANYNPMYLEFRKTRNFFASVLFFGMLALLEFGGAPILKTVMERPGFAALLFLGNIAVGFIYSRYRWGKLAPKLAARYNQHNQGLIEEIRSLIENTANVLSVGADSGARNHNLSEPEHQQAAIGRLHRSLLDRRCKLLQQITKEQVTGWLDVLSSTTKTAISIPAELEGVLQETEKYRPDVMLYKSQIYMWVLFCIPCILWDLIFHFMWDLFDAIFSFFGGHFQEVADKHVTKVNVIPTKEDVKA